MTLAAGTKLGPYEILAVLGAGGMGEVYRARDLELERDVAVKVLHDDQARDPERLDRFAREARLLAALNHPNIATVHGQGESNGVRFLVMELVPGQTLARLLTKGPLPLSETLAIGCQIAAALEAAHDHSIIHRDLKPANIKVTPEGRVKVLDFGLAKSLMSEAVVDPDRSTGSFHQGTREGAILGTPTYMSPEQVRGTPLDKRSDIWSFGCVVYEALVGEPAFAGDTMTDTLAAVLEREPDFAKLPPTVPARVCQLLRRCLQKDHRQRLRDIGDAGIELQEASAAEADHPASKPEVPRLTRRAALAALGVAGAGAVSFLAGRWSAGPSAERADAHHSVPETPQWSGELLLTDSARAFLPRVSPDGQWLAFIVILRGQSQVAVMKLGSGKWRAITEEQSAGLVNALCWTPDGTEVYFDRVFEGSQSIRRVPVVGGEERLVLDDASTPQMLADGSLLVTKSDAARVTRIQRYWSDRNRLEPVGPPVMGELTWKPSWRAFADGKEAVLWMRPAGHAKAGDAAALEVLDLASGKTRPLAPEGVPVRGSLGTGGFGPLALDPQGRWVYTGQMAGDLLRIIALPRAGGALPRPLFTLADRVYGLDVGPDGSVFFDYSRLQGDLLRFTPAGGIPERLASASRVSYGPALQFPAPDGRILFLGSVTGQERLLVAHPGKEPVTFAETTTETTNPAALVGAGEVAFRAGGKLVLASIATGRIIRRLERSPAEHLRSLAASPDGKTLYYVLAGQLWSMPTDDSQPPTNLCPGECVAVDPRSPSLVVQRNEADGNRLLRLPLDGGKPESIPIVSDLRLAADGIAPHAVGRDGRILIPVASKDSWYYSPGILDPMTGKVEHVRLDYEGDVVVPNWTDDGKILARGMPLGTEIWRFRPSK